MQNEINAILAPAKAKGLDTGAEQIGTLWQIWVGSHAGARENGTSLARELMRLAMPELVKAEPEPALKPATFHTAKPEPVEIPRFLRDDTEAEALRAEVAALKAERDAIPESVKEFIREGEPFGEAQSRLWQLYNTLTGKLMSGLASSEEARMHSRLHGALYWVSRGAVDVI